MYISVKANKNTETYSPFFLANYVNSDIVANAVKIPRWNDACADSSPPSTYPPSEKGQMIQGGEEVMLGTPSHG